MHFTSLLRRNSFIVTYSMSLFFTLACVCTTNTAFRLLKPDSWKTSYKAQNFY